MHCSRMFGLSLTVFGRSGKWSSVAWSVALHQLAEEIFCIGWHWFFRRVWHHHRFNWVIPRSQLLLTASLRWSLKLWAFALDFSQCCHQLLNRVAAPLCQGGHINWFGRFWLKVVELRALHVTYPLHEVHASFKKAPRDRTRDHNSPQIFSVPQSSRPLY